MENKNKTRTLKIRGQEVEVSEEVYRAYIRPIRAEQRRKRREWKCQKLSETGGYYVRCKERCDQCPYYLAGNNAIGNKLSLDRMADEGVDVEDNNADLEAKYIEQETQDEKYANLHAAISTLKPRQQEMVRKIYFECGLWCYEKRGITRYGTHLQSVKKSFRKKLKKFSIRPSTSPISCPWLSERGS